MQSITASANCFPRVHERYKGMNRQRKRKTGELLPPCKCPHHTEHESILRAHLYQIIKGGEIAERILREDKKLSAAEKRRLRKAVKAGEWAKGIAEEYKQTDKRKALEFQSQYK